MQTELAQAIAGALRVSLTGDQVTRSVGTTNQAAHDLVLRARHQADVYTEPSLRAALTLYGQAIALDSSYADAWAGVADVWARLADDYIAPTEALPHMRPAIARAMALDSSAAQPHAQLAEILFWYDRDFPRAQREFERALRTDSADAFTQVQFSDMLLITRGMRDSALAALHRAERLDPLSLFLGLTLPGNFIAAGDLSSARDACARSRELDSLRFGGCTRWIGLAEGRLDADSVRAFERRLRAPQFADSSWLGWLALFEAKVGLKADARRDIAAHIARYERAGRYLQEGEAVRVYALLGDMPEAFKWLERGYAANSSGMLWLRTWPEYRSLYGDPRFEALVKKVGLK